MDRSWKNVFFILGILAALYILFRIIIPFIVEAVSWLIGAALLVLKWGIIVVAVALIVGVVIKLISKNKYY